MVMARVHGIRPSKWAEVWLTSNFQQVMDRHVCALLQLFGGVPLIQDADIPSHTYAWCFPAASAAVRFSMAPSGFAPLRHVGQRRPGELGAALLQPERSAAGAGSHRGVHGHHPGRKRRRRHRRHVQADGLLRREGRPRKGEPGVAHDGSSRAAPPLPPCQTRCGDRSTARATTPATARRTTAAGAWDPAPPNPPPPATTARRSAVGTSTRASAAARGRRRRRRAGGAADFSPRSV